jgi:hypothetical protein
MVLSFAQPQSTSPFFCAFEQLCSGELMTEAHVGSLHSVGTCERTKSDASSRSFLETSAGPCLIPLEYGDATRPACEYEHPTP